MTGYCRTRRCLRQYILQYFGEFAPDYCGGCFNCLHNFQEVDVTREARCILRCVEDLGGHFGVGVVAETLCGAATEKVRKFRLDREESYGLLKDLTQKQVRERIRFLIEEGVLALSPGEYPVVGPGPRAEALDQGDLVLTMPEVREERPAPARRQPAELDGRQAELFDRLRALRAAIARRQGVPAYVVFSDRTLRELALTWPQTPAEFRAVAGVGDVKAAKYGQAFLEEIRRFAENA